MFQILLPTHLEKEPGAKEEVHHGEPKESRQRWRQNATEVQVMASGSIQGRQREAGKDNARSKKGLDDL